MEVPEKYGPHDAEALRRASEAIHVPLGDERAEKILRESLVYRCVVFELACADLGKAFLASFESVLRRFRREKLKEPEA